MLKIVFILTVLCFLGIEMQADDFYASPSGSPLGNGSSSNPWDLQTALDQPSAVNPGDTIWLRGGTYAGLFTSRLTGSPTQPFMVRQYPGERAILDGKSLDVGGAVLEVLGAYTWFCGFEITCTSNDRYSSIPGSDPPPSQLMLSGGAEVGNNVTTPGIKFINLVVHDTRQGFSVWKGATDCEVYGSIMYYNGWTSTDRGHGHGVYTQNDMPSQRLIRDNIAFSNCSHGVQAYGSDTAPINDITLDNNALFLNADRDFILGGGTVAQNPVINRNYCYKGGGASQVGQIVGVLNASITDNFFMMPDGGVALRFRSVFPSQINSFAGNLIWGDIDGFSASDYPDNNYTLSRPAGVQAFVRPNLYEAGRANIIILNFDQKSAVSVEVSGLLAAGDPYVVLDAQNYFGSPILSGSASGSPVSITIPMTSTAVVKPIGKLDRAFINPHTPPEFGVFILFKGQGPILVPPPPGHKH